MHAAVRVLLAILRLIALLCSTLPRLVPVDLARNASKLARILALLVEAEAIAGLMHLHARLLAHSDGSYRHWNVQILTAVDLGRARQHL